MRVCLTVHGEQPMSSATATMPSGAPSRFAASREAVPSLAGSPAGANAGACTGPALRARNGQFTGRLRPRRFPTIWPLSILIRCRTSMSVMSALLPLRAVPSNAVSNERRNLQIEPPQATAEQSDEKQLSLQGRALQKSPHEPHKENNRD